VQYFVKRILKKMQYNYKEIEKNWQQKWQENQKVKTHFTKILNFKFENKNNFQS
jgi:hypothetical protein